MIRMSMEAAPPKLVLVTGCPRSGTTAVASWLLSSPDVAGGVETRVAAAARAFVKESRRFRTDIDGAERERAGKLLRELVVRSYDAGVGEGPRGRGDGQTSRTESSDLAGPLVPPSPPRLPSRPRVVLDKEPLEPVLVPGEDYRSWLEDVEEIGYEPLFVVRHPVPTIWSMSRRLWGWSLAGGEQPRSYSILTCIDVWKKNARLALRAESMGKPVVRHDALVQSPATATVVRRQLEDALQIKLDEFVPRATKVVDFDEATLHRISLETALEARLLGYDGRDRRGVPTVCLLTGRPGAGKTSIAERVVHLLADRRVVVVDGDLARLILWPELGYDEQGRREALRRATVLARRIASQGATAIVAMVAPFADARAEMRKAVEGGGALFHEVHVHARPEVLEERRPTRPLVEVAYQTPAAPRLGIDTSDEAVATSAARVAEVLA